MHLNTHYFIELRMFLFKQNSKHFKSEEKNVKRIWRIFVVPHFFSSFFGCTTSDKGYYKGQKQMMCILNLAQMYMSMDGFFSRVALFVCEWSRCYQKPIRLILFLLFLLDLFVCLSLLWVWVRVFSVWG